MGKFKKTLEEKANDIAAYPKKQLWDNSIPGMIRREIALTVDQIKRLRDRHDEQFHRLLRVECYVDTELMQMEARQPRYVPYHFPEKDKLKQRLFDIEKERRNLSLRLEEKTQGLEEKLLNLVNRCGVLDIRE
jgi:ATP-dependent RNA circularization protein (DNA/RNA ligase family)